MSHNVAPTGARAGEHCEERTGARSVWFRAPYAVRWPGLGAAQRRLAFELERLEERIGETGGSGRQAATECSFTENQASARLALTPAPFTGPFVKARSVAEERPTPETELPTPLSSMNLRGFTNSCGEPVYASPVASGYNPQPQVTVVYPPPSQPAYNMYVAPTQGGCDEYGQPAAVPPAPASASAPGRSPIYLIAFKDHAIQAAESYFVGGNALHYVTLEHAEKQAPLDSVDRALSGQLNRERHVAFTLPGE